MPLKHFKNFFSKYRLGFLFFTILGVIALGSLFFFLDLEDVVRPLKNLKPWHIALLVLSDALLMLISAIRWQIVVSSFGAKVPLWKLFLYRYPMNALNYTTPLPGITGQTLGVLLLKREGMPYKTATTTLLLDTFIAVQGAIIYGVAFLAAWTLGKTFGLSHLTMLATFGLISFFGILLTLLPMFLVKTRVLDLNESRGQPPKTHSREQNTQNPHIKQFWKEKFRWIGEVFLLSLGWGRKNPEGIIKMVFFSFLGHLGSVARIFFVFLFLGSAANLVGAGVMEAFFTFSFLTPTWQGIGGFEAAGALGGSLLGYSVGIGLSVALTLRFLRLISAGLGYLLLIVYGIRILKK